MRNPTAQNLAMRDPALAALVGAIGSPGTDFGYDSRGPRQSTSFGDDMGFGGDDMGFGFGAEYHPPRPPHPQHRALAAHHARRRAHTDRRMLLLDPNKYSETKIERYTFSMSNPLTLGTPGAIDVSDQPDTSLRPQRVVMNAPMPAFVTIAEIKVANVSVTVGDIEDAYTYSAGAQGVVLDMPTLSPSNKAKVLGSYLGFVPAGYTAGFAYPFIITFQGPSTMAAG